MCSVNEADDAKRCMEPKSKESVIGISCQKCREEKAVVQILQMKLAYCRECFLIHVNHKFRSTLGKSKMMRPSDNILAAFSGSNKSLAMLHLLNAGLSEKSHKRFLFSVQALFIDEGAVLGLSETERALNLRNMAKISSKLGFTLFATTLDCIFREGDKALCFLPNETEYFEVNASSEMKLLQLINSVSSLTAKEDLVSQLRKRCLIEAAKELDCGKVFVADSGTDLAVEILTNISLGRGSHLHHDVAFCDARNLEVKIIRPMRELSRKEIVYFTTFHRLEGVQIPSLGTKAAVDASIQNLAEHFVMELMEDFPSTVSTVFRTGEKLGGGGPTHTETASCEEELSCAICQAHFDDQTSECSSLKATQFSQLVSSLGPCGFDNLLLKRVSADLELGVVDKSPSDCSSSKESECCVTDDQKCKCEIEGPSIGEISTCLCYGCRLIVKDMVPPVQFPQFVVSTVLRRKHLRAMRENIEQFLL